MKRLTLVAALGCVLLAPAAWPQQKEPAESTETRAEEAAKDVTEGQEGGSMEVFAWLNFALLTAGLVWIFRKNAVPYFASRALGIRKEMIAAEDTRLAAERKLGEVEARFARLQADIQSLKDDATRAEAAEHARMQEETAAALAKIQQHAINEIESAGKSARMELKRYTAQLAIEIAEHRVRARMTPSTQDTLFRGFLHQIDEASRAQST